MAQLITVGETMAVLTPDRNGPLRYAPNFRPYIAGSESNVAIGAAKLGVSTEWFSRLGDDEFGHLIRGKILAEGVECGNVIFDSGHPTGIMFKEIGPRDTKVFYYRSGSAASRLCPSDLDRLSVKGAEIVYMTGITPVLSESCRDTVEELYGRAMRENVMIAFDPNIRKKLWKGIDHIPFLRSLVLKSDIVLTGLSEAMEIFQAETTEDIIETIFREGRAKHIAIKDGGKGALVTDGNRVVNLPPFPCRPVETVGAGDGFNAGFLAGIIKGEKIEKAGFMGSVCGAMATQTAGDYEGYPDAAQMERIMRGQQEITR